MSPCVLARCLPRTLTPHTYTHTHVSMNVYTCTPGQVAPSRTLQRVGRAVGRAVMMMRMPGNGWGQSKRAAEPRGSRYDRCRLWYLPTACILAPASHTTAAAPNRSLPPSAAHMSCSIHDLLHHQLLLTHSDQLLLTHRLSTPSPRPYTLDHTPIANMLSCHKHNMFLGNE